MMTAGASDPIRSDVLRCPTCGARQEWAETCRRCRSDLSLLVHLADAWRRYRRRALVALQAGRLAEATRLARRCHELAPSDRSRQLLAVCCLLAEDWPAALEAAGPLLDEREGGVESRE